jgi:hypothetical protein
MTSHHEPVNPQSAQARIRGWLPAILISVLISLTIVSPFFWLGSATGHDFQYHAASWLDAAGQWKEGIVYPRWTEWADYGFGEPRFIFYPPFSWMLGASLGSVLPWNHVPIFFIVLAQTFAGLSAFALARRMLPRRAALFCVAFYAANPYALLIVYMRSDFAELLANAFFPLLFLLVLQICELVERPASKAPQKLARLTIVWFAVVFAAIWLSNAPAGVIASYSSFAVFVFAAFTRKSWQPLTRGMAGLALGFGLAGFYILPAAYEQRWVNIAQALSAGLLPTENFLYTVINDPEHTLFNWIASTIAILLMVLTGLAALRARRKEQNSESSVERRVWLVLLLLAGLATLLMLRFTSPLWAVLPKLRFVQFPWRWMSLLAVVFAVFAGSTMSRRWGWIWAVVTFALIGGTAVVLVQRGWWDTQDIPALRAAIASGVGFDGTDEYDPAGDDHTNLPTKSPKAIVMDTDSIPGPNSIPKIRVERWSPEDKEVAVSSREPFFLGLRLLNYPAWRAEVNGSAVTPRSGDDYNQMIVPVPTGESHVSVRFVRTLDRTLGGGLSLLSALVALGLLVTGIRRGSTRREP